MPRLNPVVPESCRDPLSICKDIFALCPCMVDIRRAPPRDLCQGILRAKKRPPPTNSSGLEDILGRGGEVLLWSVPLLLMTAQAWGSRS